MTTPSRKSKEIRVAEQHCQEQGYVQCGANWYRCYGQGLLQVVTFDGLPDRITGKHSVALGIYSLYSQIMWVNFTYRRTRRDLVLNITSDMLINGQDDSCSIELMLEHGLPLLDKIDTHAKLAEFLESMDTRNGFSVIVNDSNKVVPYLLSGQITKVLATINAIEQQNLHAHAVNCSTLEKNDPELHRKKLNDRLYPLIKLRECIVSQDLTNVFKLLQSNYHTNVDYLLGIGISVPSNSASQMELVKLMNIH